MEKLSDERWVWVPFEVDKKFDGYRIDRFLSQRLIAYSRNKVQKILAESRVMKEGRVVRPSSRVKNGDKIQIAYLRRPEKPLATDASLPILYEDDALIVINKPSDLLSHPTDKVVQHTVLGILRQSRPDIPKFYLLHRLDRETSGVLALGKTEQAARRWTRHMEQHHVHKEYLAIVRGIPEPKEGTLDWPIGREGGDIKVRQWINVPDSVSAITRYKVLQSFHNPSSISLLRIFPETGRLHQIRVHLAAFGHPLLGDALYTGTGEAYRKRIDRTFKEKDQNALGFGRVALHANILRFPHPLTGENLCVEAPLPEDFHQLFPE